MATSSVTYNFIISSPESVKRFVEAIDEADRDRSPKQALPGRQLTDHAGNPGFSGKKEEKIRYIKNGNSVPALLRTLPRILPYLYGR